MIALATVLQHNRALRYLNLEAPNLPPLEEEPILHISKMLQVNTGLSELKLGKSKIGDQGALYLAQNLEDNQTLTTLDLRW